MKNISGIIRKFKNRYCDGGSVIERSLLCAVCDAEWEGFYESTDVKCAKKAMASGWSVVKGKVMCGQCNSHET